MAALLMGEPEYQALLANAGPGQSKSKAWRAISPISESACCSRDCDIQLQVHVTKNSLVLLDYARVKTKICI